MIRGIVSTLLLSIITAGPLVAQEAASTPEPRGRQFAGLHFGIALSASHDLDQNRVEEAVIETEVESVNGVPTPLAKVRVIKGENTRARIMLESHYFFTKKVPAHQPPRLGWGPFVALQPGTDEIVEAIGAGFMLGWRREHSPSESFNIGIGLVVDSNVRVLGDGFVRNQPAPVDEEGKPLPIRFNETDQSGYLIVFSFGF